MPRNQSLESTDADLRRVEAQHKEIQTLLARIEDRFGNHFTGNHGLADVGRLLSNLEKRLTEHFALEEKVGFLDRALEVAPRLSRRASGLRKQHESLEKNLRELLKAAEGAMNPDDSWRRTAADFRRFAAELRRHEKAEDELEIAAHMDDLGGGD